MSESGEENEDTLNDQNNADDDDEFSFYLQFTKPLVLDLTEPEDRAMAAAWVRKLEGGSNAPEEKQLRINYLKLLLFVLQRGRLGGIFRKQPPSGPLQSFPAGFNVFDMGNLILDQDDLQPSGAGDGRAVNYNIEISNDLREFVASQEIPNFGIQMYYAWSADEPIHKWTLYDEDKFPQYILDKIKLLKETQSDEKSGSLTKNGGQTKKKICDLPVLEKCSKKKVKSPQEIERSQGRSFHTYMGLVGRMGNFEKCDGDLERHPRPQPPQARGTCSRRISQSQNQNQCPGQGQRRFTNQECEVDHGEDNFHNFMPGLSDLVNAQSRPCLCPYPCHHTECPEHRGARGGSHHELIARGSMTNTSTKQICAPSDWGASGSQTVTKVSAPTRFNEFDPSNARMSSIGPPHGSQGAHCPHKRSASSPTSKSNCPSRTNFEPPPQDFYGRQNFSQAPGVLNNFCTCPCPRQPQPMIGHSASTTGVMGGMGGMAGMGGMPGMGGMEYMGGMPGMGYMGGMPGIGCMGGMGGMGVMGGMGGMSGMGGMRGMPGMPGIGGMGYMASMGGIGGMPNMGAMGGMPGMGNIGGMGTMGGGRTCPSGRAIAQEKSRPNVRGHSNDSGQHATNFRTPPNANCSRVEGTPAQAAMPVRSRSGMGNTRSRPNVLHCYDNQQVDASFTHTIQKNVNAMECSGTYTRGLPIAGEENTMHSQACMEDGSPDELTKKLERTALITAARENKGNLAAKKSLFDAGPQKSQSAQFHTPNTVTVTKRQQTPAVCPTMERRNPACISSDSERMMMQSDRSSSMEPLSQSQSPRPQAPCPTPQQTQYCNLKAQKCHNHSFQSQNNYGQDRQACPSGTLKTLSPIRPGTAKTVNLNIQHQNAKGGGTFAVNDESSRFCNMPGLLQDMRQMIENYRPAAEEHCPSRPESCAIDQRESNLGVDFDFTSYMEPPPPKPDVYYSPQPRRKNIVVSPCPERDVASLPDRMTGMGIFRPQKMPTQAQPLPNTPPDCAYIDYCKYEGDEESFLYGIGESSYDQPRGHLCPPEEQQHLPISSMQMPSSSHQTRERSPATAERVRDCSRRRDHSADAHQGLQESKVHHMNLPKTPQKSSRRDNFMCSTPTRSFTTLPTTVSSIHQSCLTDTHHGSPKTILADCDDQSHTEFVQLFGGSRHDETYSCPSQQRDSVHFETLECATHQDNW